MTGFSRSSSVRRLILPVLLFAAPAPVMAATPPDQTDRDVRIRLQWTGDKPEKWAGVLEMSQGSFAKPVSLSSSPSEAGTLWADGQTLLLGRHNPRRNDGFDVTVLAPRSARLCFTLKTEAQGGSQRQFEWTVADIGRKPIGFMFGAGNGLLSVRRVPGDSLRVSIDHDPHLIYSPGETFKAGVTPDPNATTGTCSDAKIEWEIQNPAGRVISTGSAPLPQFAYRTTQPRIPIEFPLPDEEGCYDLRFRFRANASDVLQSIVQVLVLATSDASHLQQAHAEVVVDRFRIDNTASGRLESAVLSTAATSGVNRLVGPYLSTPDSLANFGVPRASGDAAERDAASWNSFYAGAQRATDYLRGSGGNCLMLPVFAEGSTMYPSAFVERSLRFDSSLLSSSGRDTRQKDVVEMLYRVFDRNGFTFIPELQFSSPLAALERQLASSESETQGIELIGSDGRSWREVHGSSRDLTPYYNPLDPRVQDAVLDVIREFVERYGSHPSFRGIAIELDSRGYFQFPGVEWGCDEATLARFQRDTGVQVNERSQLQSGEPRSKWITWRCGELARFYRRIVDTTHASVPSGRVILVRKQSQPSGSELLAQGLDFSRLAGAPHLVLLPYSSNGSISIELDRDSPLEPMGEALAPVDSTRR
jgi:hypothetical protein